MKLLYTVKLFLILTQCSHAMPLNDHSNSTILTPGEQLSQYYANELNSQAKEICIKLKNISEKILKDEAVQFSATPLMQEFKRNITQYQLVFEFKKRFAEDGYFVLDFSNMVAGYYHLKPNADNESVYILQLLRKLGYDAIREKYKIKLSKFVSEKFLPRFENLKGQILRQPNISESDSKLIKWVNFLQECREYECFLITFDSFESMNASPGNTYFGFIIEKMFEDIIIFSHEVVKFANGVLNDSRLSKLKPALRKQLIANLHDLIKIHNNVDYPNEVFFLPQIYYYLIYRFNNYSSISLKERQLITNIFNEHGYVELYFIKEGKSGFEYDYLTNFEKEKTTLNEKDLANLNNFLEVIDHLRKSTNLQERIAALEPLKERHFFVNK